MPLTCLKSAIFNSSHMFIIEIKSFLHWHPAVQHLGLNWLVVQDLANKGGGKLLSFPYSTMNTTGQNCNAE